MKKLLIAGAAFVALSSGRLLPMRRPHFSTPRTTLRGKSSRPRTKSHAGTSKQARAIVEGLEADVVTFNQVTDIDLLAKKTARRRGW